MLGKNDQYKIHGHICENNAVNDLVIYTILSGKMKIDRKNGELTGKMLSAKLMVVSPRMMLRMSLGICNKSYRK